MKSFGDLLSCCKGLRRSKVKEYGKGFGILAVYSTELGQFHSVGAAWNSGLMCAVWEGG